MASDERPPQLQPPPRFPDRTHGHVVGDNGRGDLRSAPIARVGRAVLFGALFIALIGVFAVLPRWASTRQPATGPQNPAVDRTAAFAPPLSPQTGPDTAAPAAPPPPRQASSPTPRREQSPRVLPPPAAPPDQAAFTAAMSSGLKALEDGHWQAAREHFEAAAHLRPGAPEVADGLARAAAAERLSLVKAGLNRGLELETAENWREAEKTYAQVLSVYPEAAGALDGRERTAYRASIDEQLEYHIRNPRRLSSPQVFEDASGLLAQAQELDPRGLRLQNQVSSLEKILEVAATPVPVVVVSDNLTEVVIYRVDRLGVFSRRELELRPGNYTAVGSRAGFRDVRVRFDVTPGGPSQPVTVVCTEKL